MIEVIKGYLEIKLAGEEWSYNFDLNGVFFYGRGHRYWFAYDVLSNEVTLSHALNNEFSIGFYNCYLSEMEISLFAALYQMYGFHAAMVTNLDRAIYKY